MESYTIRVVKYGSKSIYNGILNNNYFKVLVKGSFT